MGQTDSGQTDRRQTVITPRHTVARDLALRCGAALRVNGASYTEVQAMRHFILS